jgi:hypothetical protein
MRERLQDMLSDREMNPESAGKWRRMSFQDELTPWSIILLQKPPIAQVLQNFPMFYATRRFITVYTTALHWSLYRTR